MTKERDDGREGEKEGDEGTRRGKEGVCIKCVYTKIHYI